ncbi:VC2046/SO_2500 family protein [Paraglaciecola aquimarina]|uniref:VC2046/SO_2500 family protein n=1 Tax=Paraglaciecola aquimarina TaxID=1235557 RepID=A0ABU3SW88_9ALTE|nr:VC2046/SO_2500 family protein [Paraglaciecola aquimarina]MDU0354177.1 VC2046/SO_2500 family protein [Paraglaciecola aquimarina]
MLKSWLNDAITSVTTNLHLDDLLLAPNDVTEQTPLTGLDPVIVRDRELNGEINRASAQGAKFALLLAMLEQNNLYRPTLYEPPAVELDKTTASTLHFYRSSPLMADAESWQNISQTRMLVSAGHIHSAQLWLAMHPEPLSQFNNPLQIEAQVMANCSYPTQNRLQQKIDNTIDVNEAGLYDILQELTTAV